jgi:hypothetical protein
MTAIDFPNSPTTGTSFSAGGKTWTYNGSVWVLNPRTASKTAYDIAVENGFVGTEEAWLESLVGEDGVIGRDGRFIVSATAPASPEVGDAWFNSETSRMFIYYDSYWVETGVSVAGAAGPAGVVAATSPITYNSETQTVGITQSGLTLEQSQITGLSTALSGKQDVVSGVSSTEIGYLDGVTSGIQGQINSKYNTSGGTVSGKITAQGSNTIAAGSDWASTTLEIQANNTAGQNPGVSLHALNSSAMSLWHPRGSQSLLVQGNNNVIDSASGSRSVRNITVSTSDPSGGTDGDVWLKYNA